MIAAAWIAAAAEELRGGRRAWSRGAHRGRGVVAACVLLWTGAGWGGAHPDARLPAGEPGPEALRADVRALADPALRGRAAGTAGAAAARRFLMDRLRQVGAQPQGEGGYQQRFVTAGGDTLVNLVALLPGEGEFADRAHVVVGGHYDHLGVAAGGDPQAGAVYPGADDNASGVAALLDLARRMESHRDDIVLVLFDGEERGRLGSRYYVEHPARPLSSAVAMINLDTVGRLTDGKLTVFGVGTAAELENVVRGVNLGFRFDLQLVPRGSTASDDQSFLERGVAALHLFSGANADYHRPSDTADKVNFDGLARIAEFAAELARYLADRGGPLTFMPDGAERAAREAASTGAAGGGESPSRRRVSFGSIPDFQRQGGGVLLTGVLPGSPAAQAGLQAGDVLVEFGGTPVDNLVDYSEALKRYAPGDQVLVVYLRGSERNAATVTLVERK